MFCLRENITHTRRPCQRVRRSGGIEGDAGNILQGFAVGLAVAAELQLQLPDVYKGGVAGTPSRLSLPQHAEGLPELGHPQ
jgi:hypothetical protein